MKASDLKNRPVVSLKDGTKVGEVSDLTLDATNIQVGSLLVAGSDGNSILPYRSVRTIGTDAVTIDNSGTLQAPADRSGDEERRVSTLIGLPVVNQEGSIIGTMEDLEFDDQYGRVITLVVRRGGVLGIGGSHESVPRTAIRGIGPTLIAVDTAIPVASTSKTPAASPTSRVR